MSVIYRGFSVPQMISLLNQYTRKFELVKNDVKEKSGDFRITIYSDEHGEIESFGSLSYVVIQAFKPFAGQAREHINKTQKTIVEFLKEES